MKTSWSLPEQAISFRLGNYNRDFVFKVHLVCLSCCGAQSDLASATLLIQGFTAHLPMDFAGYFVLLLGELLLLKAGTWGLLWMGGNEPVSVPGEELPGSKITTAHGWETGIQQQAKPALSLQVDLLRALITWLEEKVKSFQSIPNSHSIYRLLEPLGSPQASFSLTFLPSATRICLPGTLHCCSTGWASFLLSHQLSLPLLSSRPRLWSASYKISLPNRSFPSLLILLSCPPTTELVSC